MNQVFKYLSYSKQAFHQKMDRILQQRELEALLLPIIKELRQEHPHVAARQLYQILKPDNIGRDKFEQLCFMHGLKLPRLKSYRRTTDSSGVIRFPNLTEGREFTDINQAWGSDITYYQIGNRFYYLTFIIDLYSRVIVGYSVSRKLLTEQTTIPALQMAIENRQPQPGLIFHSDGGGQYYCKAFLNLTRENKMKNSMCDAAYENPYAERINGTIKNQYLKGYNPRSYEGLIQSTKRAVKNYNCIRPHSSLEKMPPVVFEKQLPAGGSSSEHDNFCNFGSTIEPHQKNHHIQMTNKTRLKSVKKKVNVF